MAFLCRRVPCLWKYTSDRDHRKRYNTRRYQKRHSQEPSFLLPTYTPVRSVWKLQATTAESAWSWGTSQPAASLKPMSESTIRSSRMHDCLLRPVCKWLQRSRSLDAMNAENTVHESHRFHMWVDHKRRPSSVQVARCDYIIFIHHLLISSQEIVWSTIQLFG